jgi:hypothetical protein
VSRDIWETEEIDKELLDGFLARFEKDAYRSNRTKFEDMEAEIHFKYTFERYAGEEKWTGQISVEVYDDYFQARGDETLLDEYFKDERIQELELD